MELPKFFSSTVGKIAIIFVAAIILNFIGRHIVRILVRRSVKRAKGETKLDERKRENTIITILSTTFIALVWMWAFCAILTALGVNVAALLTGAGIIGVFVGLSAQNTIKDFLAGISILVEKQYRVGDTITLAGGSTGSVGTMGKVEEITLRITKLRDINGQLITIRNGEPTVVTNQTLNYATVVLDIVVTYDSDLTAVEQTINKIGEQIAADPEWQLMIDRPMSFQRVDNFTDQGVVVRITGNVKPASQWDVAGEYRQRLFKAFAKNPKTSLAHTGA